jgi:hypothetical protein
MPSSQLRNGLRQHAGEISERAAIAENAKSMGKATPCWQENDHSTTAESCTIALCLS